MKEAKAKCCSPSQGEADVSAVCLICNSRFFLKSVDVKSHQCKFADIFTDLFEMFVKDMKWDVKAGGGKRNYNFKKEIFPFCKSCRLILMNLYNLHDQVNDGIRAIEQIVANVSAKILMASADTADESSGSGVDGESPGQSSSTFGSDLLKGNSGILKEKASGHFGKVQWFRNVAYTGFKPQVSIARNLRKIADDHLPLLASKSSCGSSHVTKDSGHSVVVASIRNARTVPPIANECEAVAGETMQEDYADVSAERRDVPTLVIKIDERQYQYEKYIFEKQEDGKCQCWTCGHIVKSSLDIRNHVETIHWVAENSNQYSCEVCGKGFYWFRCLRKHAASHGNTNFRRLHDCEICGKSFKRYSVLYHHKNEVHGRKNLFGSYGARIRDSTNLYLQSHVANSRTGVKPFTCDICNKAFASAKKPYLKQHQNVHMKKKKYYCEICRLINYYYW